MYKVLLDGKPIYDPLIGIALTDPTVELAEGKSGSFTCGIPPGNPGYGKIKKLVSVIEVLQDHDSLFVGRVLSAEKDFYGVETITCEGELAYLLDSIQRPAEYHDITVRGFLQTLIDNHNAQVDEAKQFEVGEVTVTDSNDSLYRYTNWKTTLDDINDKLVSRLGGHIRIRHADGHRYLDYLADFDNTNTQTIAFGENLLDYTENTTADDLATCIIPLGAAIENQTDDPQALQKYTTCADANGGSDYVCDSDAIANYGRVFKVVHFDSVTLPANLKTKGEQYLHDTQFEKMALTVTAVDKHLLSGDFERIKVGDRIRCLSKPHGMDRFFPVTKRSIHLDAPEQDTITLGDTVSVSYTERANKDNDAIYQQIDHIPPQSATLKLAQDNATALLTAATTGHVVTRANEILIMDTDDTKTAQHVWRWDVNGWGYSSTGIDGPYKLAATMDGAIVADCITAGTMSAEHIRTGTLKSQDDVVNFDLDNGSLTINMHISKYLSSSKMVLNGSGLRVFDAAQTKPQMTLSCIVSGDTFNPDGSRVNLGGTIDIPYYDTKGNKLSSIWIEGDYISIDGPTGLPIAKISSDMLLVGSQSALLFYAGRAVNTGDNHASFTLGDGTEPVWILGPSDDPSGRDWTILFESGSLNDIVIGRDVSMNNNTISRVKLSSPKIENAEFDGAPSFPDGITIGGETLDGKNDGVTQKLNLFGAGENGSTRQLDVKNGRITSVQDL